MNKPSDYESISIAGSLSIPAGGYVCKIMGVKETKSKTGKEMIEVSLDIAEGTLAEHYAKAYRNNTSDNKRWGCVYRVLTKDKDGNTNRDFKRLCVMTEESNQGFKVVWGDKFEECFKNKIIGVVFGREQFMGNNGLAWSCKPKRLAAAKDIREGRFEVPADKLYSDGSTTVDAKGYVEVTAEDDDLPF